MEHMEHIEQAVRRLHRIEATLGFVAQSGPEASVFNVMEVNELIREEVARVLACLDLAGKCKQVPAAMTLAPEGAGEVVAFTRSTTRA